MQSIRSPIGNELIVRTARRVRLGPLCVDIRSNEAEFGGLRYFPCNENCDAAQPDFTVSFCNLCIDQPWPLERLRSGFDDSYRAKRFAAGYYITDHFGSPAYLLTRDRQYWIFGTDFAPILWPFVVKLLLTLYSMQHELLHLKSAAVAVDGSGSLLVARGAGGKTVLLARLCSEGAHFLSNTHVLLDGPKIIGIPTAMRVRRDALFTPIIAQRHLAPALKGGEHIADPQADLGWSSGVTAPLTNICLVDFRGPAVQRLERIDSDILYEYMEQFSLALNVYGLKEDILDFLRGDQLQFSRQVQLMKHQLRAAIAACRCYYISCDVMDPRGLAAVQQLLGRRASNS